MSPRIMLRVAAVAVAAACVGLPARLAADVLTVGQNFLGTTRSQSGFIPPDTMGAVGTNHVVELINGQYAVYSKTGSTLQRSSLDSFWTSAGVSPTSFAFDPRVLYDSSSNRWFAASVDNSRAANSYLVAVSNSSDPTAGWTGFKIDADTDNNRWADFPMLGVDSKGVYVTANMFGISGASTTSAALVIPKADLIGPTPTIANRTLFEDVNPNGTGFSVQPVVNLDGSGPTNRQLLLSAFNSPAGVLKTTQIDTTNINNPSLQTAGGFITVAAKPNPTPAAQPGTKQDIDAGDSRFSGNVVVRDDIMWAVQTIEEAGKDALRWFKIDALTNTLLQDGIITDALLEYYFPSIAVNELGDVVIGFSGSSELDFVGTYAVLGETLAGVTTFGDVILIQAGLDDYQRLDTGGRNRWGDYSSTVVDPTNPNVFWTFQEYVVADNEWATRITQLNITPAAIPEPSSLLLTSLIGLVTGGVAWRRRRAA